MLDFMSDHKNKQIKNYKSRAMLRRNCTTAHKLFGRQVK